MARRFARGLYAITPDQPDTGKLVAAVDAALRGGAAMVQYRNKSADAATRRTQSAALVACCNSRGVPLIVNDDACLAAEVDAGGAHLGAQDGELSSARRLLGPGRLLGASCYNRLELAESALDAGADYVAFGSFFTSATKPDAVRAAPALIAAIKQRRPQAGVAAIGGITLANAPSLVAAGADWLCVIAALFEAADVEAAAHGFSRLFATASQRSS
jgi:thiamine-phosphate pyrophosphorylase